MNYNFFDTHSHLHFKDFDEDRDSVILEMQNKGIGTITIGTDYDDSKKAIALAEKYDHIFASVGFHPADNKSEIFSYEKYLELAKHKKVVAIGECGLDYFHNTKSKEEQVKIFGEHIKLAVEVNKPLMLHVRPKENMDAYFDAIEILKIEKEKYGEKLNGNFHFFAGNVEVAQKVLDLGFTMSFSGVITFTKDYDDVLHFVPLNMIHAETDSPYVAPVPYRGKRNSPLYVQEIVAKIAVVRQENFEEVRLKLLENAKRVFKIAD